MTGIDQKKNYKHFEIDFGRRLIAKFKFSPDAFWAASHDFPRIRKGALYPAHDPMETLTASIRNELTESD